MGLHLWLPPCFGPCQAENPGPFKSSDLQRTFTAAPGGAPQLQQRPRQCSPTQQSPLDPKSAQQSCWGLAPSYPRWIGKDGERGKGCHCCWLHMAQLAHAGSGFGCLLGIPCQSFPFQKLSVHQHWHTAASLVSSTAPPNPNGDSFFAADCLLLSSLALLSN